MRTLILGLIAACLSTAAAANPFSFVALGDTAYKLPRDTARVDQLVDAINGAKPAFSIHVGDFKGYSSCSDDAYLAVRQQYRKLATPLVLTPGDNDWFDCNVDTAGSFDPLDRLAALRRIFFTQPLMVGKAAIARQQDYPENARWTYERVEFATVHVIGPHNGFVRDTRLGTEAIARSTAGEGWIREAFAAARRSRAPALVLAFQADPWITNAPVYENGPLDWLRNAIGEEAATFDGQVLVVNGDSHRLTIDTPYRRADIEAGTTRGLNVTRLMVPGWPDHRAVRIMVDPAKPAVFSFEVIMAPDESRGATAEAAKP
jgi:hypothetical protein